MKLYLARHGETDENARRAYVGWQNPPLNQQGHAQATALITQLQTEPIAAIYASDLTRARQTVQPIATARNLPVQTDSRWRELHFGRWEGLTFAEIDAVEREWLERWLSNPEAVAPPGGETLAQLRSRILQALPQTENALVVTHGGPIRALIAHLTGRPFWSIPVPPGSVTCIEKGELLWSR